MKRAGIALGSNLGDKNSLMVQARDHLLQMSLSDDPFLQSSLYATSPQGCPHGADDYLNAVVEFTWPGTVEELLVHCQGIERALGRIRSGIRCEPRTADVDIIYVGDMVVNDPPRLILPHPRAHLRKFVLKPLSGRSLSCRASIKRLPACWRNWIRMRLSRFWYRNAGKLHVY